MPVDIRPGLGVSFQKRSDAVLTGLFQADNAHQNETHVQELVDVRGVFEDIYLRQFCPKQGDSHPGSKGGSCRYLLHCHGEEYDISHPKDDIACERKQYFPILPPGKEGRPANRPQFGKTHELETECPANLKERGYQQI